MPIPVNVIRQSLKMSAPFARAISASLRTLPTNSVTKYSNRFNITNCMRVFSTTVPNVQKDAEEVEVTFIKANGERVKSKGKVGDSLLDVVVNNSLDFEGFGACEGTLTCSTCHLIFKPADYEKLPEKPSDEECDMLDLAYELCDTSRLGCQITLTKEMNGLEVQVPSTINDARAVPDS